ncbi:MAG: serine/threonine-protein kinase, partial [Acidobacteria bacterium]|nr:serine/threonine-protein kinase [Acidobacteriota bacterium]
MPLPPNTRLGRYEIRSQIGAGGMGEVYLARDTKLDRKVALKILPSEFAAHPDRMRRFVQEAKAASALNHPNILTIYERDETDADPFIATELIEGETLRERLRREPITLSEALDVATQVASALAAAHQAGIIHRDIKPENVMVRGDGLVKVLDFGLAKLTAGAASDPEGETRIQSDTEPGVIMGTVAYMSPQQARGQAVDRRADVWSLGVVLYEMLSGRQPFHGETPTDTLANILQREPEPLDIGALPADIARIVGKMLAKDLEARYSTITEVVADLRSLQKRTEFEAELRRTPLPNTVTEAQTQMFGSATPSRFSGAPIDSGAARADEGFWVAVLPFKYSGNNADLTALAEGLTEEIVTGLSRFSYLKVIARSSTSRYANESVDVRSAGKELGARYVMEGSLRQAGTKLRLAVQLVDTISGAHLWAENYERT